MVFGDLPCFQGMFLVLDAVYDVGCDLTWFQELGEAANRELDLGLWVEKRCRCAIVLCFQCFLLSD